MAGAHDVGCWKLSPQRLTTRGDGEVRRRECDGTRSYRSGSRRSGAPTAWCTGGRASHAELQAGGERIGAKRVGRLMRRAGIDRAQPPTFDEDHHERPARCPCGAGSGRSGLQRRWCRSAVGGRYRAPRGALEPCGGGRPPPSARRSGPVEAEGQPEPGDTGEGGSSPDNDGTRQHCQMVRVRQARRKGVREEPVSESPSSQNHQLEPGQIGAG